MFKMQKKSKIFLNIKLCKRQCEMWDMRCVINSILCNGKMIRDFSKKIKNKIIIIVDQYKRTKVQVKWNFIATKRI